MCPVSCIFIHTGIPVVLHFLSGMRNLSHAGFPAFSLRRSYKQQAATMAETKAFMEAEMDKAFQEALKYDTHPSYRARINIIGHSGAGKTSLTRRLLGQNFHPKQESTDGIETHRIEFDLGESSGGSCVWRETEFRTEEQNPVKGVLRLWDFGGQTEFYVTHHMFLDADAINIIVMDISKPLKEKLSKDWDGKLYAGVPQTPEEFLCYWLRTIEATTAQKQREPNVVLIFTHLDLIPLAQSQSQSQYFAHEVRKILAEANLPQIGKNNMHFVSNRSGSERDFNILRLKLQQLMTSLPDWGMKIPLGWTKLELDMKTVLQTRHSLPKMTCAEVKQLAEKLLMSEEELESVLTFLHSKGDIIWFPDSGLRHVITLDPQWLVDMFKILITSEEFLHKRCLRGEALQLLQHGTVTFGALQKYWVGHDAEFLANLLYRFNLILLIRNMEAKDRMFLVPCMLPHPNNPVHLLKTKPFSHMALIFKSKYQSAYGVLLPIGTLAKLITVCSKRYQLREEHLSDMFASFEMQQGLILTIQQPHGSTITASIWCLPSELQENPLSLLLETWESVRETLTQCRVPLSPRFELLCPHWRHSDTSCDTVKVEEVAAASVLEHPSLQPVHHTCACHEEALSPTQFLGIKHGMSTVILQIPWNSMLGEIGRTKWIFMYKCLRMNIVHIISSTRCWKPTAVIKLMHICFFLERHKKLFFLSFLDFSTDAASIARAFQEACSQENTRPSYRARINIIGHSGAGKTSLTRRLLEKEFVEKHQSTDGIETHRIEFDLHSNEWSKVDLDIEKLSQPFKQRVLEKREELSNEYPKFTPLDLFGPEESNVGENITADVTERSTEAPNLSDDTVEYENEQVPEVKEEFIKELAAVQEIPASPHDQTAKPVKGVLRLWDFGGQTEFYATHHMFLDSNAINIIVLDSSKPFRDPLLQKQQKHGTKVERKEFVGVPSTHQDFLCYWMRSIYTNTEKESKRGETKENPKIIIVLTHQDEAKEGEQFLSNVKKTLEKLKQLPEVDGIHFVNNKTGSEEDFCKLRGELQKKIINLSSWGEKRPVTWLQLEADMRKQLNKGTQEHANYLKLETVESMARQYNMSFDTVILFLCFLHSKGDVVFYPDQILRDVVTLEPQWLINVFKKLITAEEFIMKRLKSEDAFLENVELTAKVCELVMTGKVKRTTLDALWEGEKNVTFLVELLEMFGLIVPMRCDKGEDQKFIVPSMLAQQKMGDWHKAEFAQNLTLVYRSMHTSKFEDLFPLDTFPNLIAACTKQPQSWSVWECGLLSFRHVSFDISEGVVLTLTQSHRSTISAAIRFNPTQHEKNPMNIILEVRAALASMLSANGVPPPSPSSPTHIICPHWSLSDYHICTVEVTEKQGLTPGRNTLQPVKQMCACHSRELKEYDFNQFQPLQDDFVRVPMVSTSLLCQWQTVLRK